MHPCPWPGGRWAPPSRKAAEDWLLGRRAALLIGVRNFEEVQNSGGQIWRIEPTTKVFFLVTTTSRPQQELLWRGGSRMILVGVDMRRKAHKTRRGPAEGVDAYA